VISIQIDIGKDQVENAMLDLYEYGENDELLDLIVSVVERTGDLSIAKNLIGKLGDTYTYLEETFGDGTE
jgi:hypothetical protein